MGNPSGDHQYPNSDEADVELAVAKATPVDASNAEDDVPLLNVVSKEAEDTEEPEPPRKQGRRVRLSSPYGLPGGHRLEVLVQGSGNGKGDQVIVVEVPQPGVAADESFIAEEVVKRPITGHWYADVFQLNYRGKDSDFCWLTFFCPMISLGYILDKLGYKSPFRWGGMAAILFGIYYVLALLPLGDDAGNLCYFFLFGMAFMARRAVRNKYKIKGTLMDDCVLAVCCQCCSTVQLFRHMKMSGDEPKSCECCCNNKPSVRATIV